MSTLELRKTYNFSIYPTAIIGDEFAGVTVVSILDPEAAAEQIDIVARHAQVYTYLSKDTVEDDPYSYDYVKVRFQNGNTRIIGLPWIKTETIVQLGAQTLTLVVKNAVADDIQRFKNFCAVGGYNDYTIALK